MPFVILLPKLNAKSEDYIAATIELYNTTHNKIFF